MHTAPKLLVPALVAASALQACAGQVVSTNGDKHPGQMHCAALSQAKLEHASVTSASLIVLTSAKTLPFAERNAPQYSRLPAFCRVMLTDRPSSDSEIRTEIWLPLTGWNGKFRGQGNGGFAVNIDYRSMAAAVATGYATSGTDTGHIGPEPTFALGHPEKVIDFGWRAIHDMTLQAKALVNTFYGKPARYSYLRRVPMADVKP